MVTDSNLQRTPDGYHVCPECGHHTSAAAGGICTVINPETFPGCCDCDCYKAIHGESFMDMIARVLHGTG